MVTFNQTEKRHKGLSVKQAVTISDLPMKEGKILYAVVYQEQYHTYFQQ